MKWHNAAAMAALLVLAVPAAAQMPDTTRYIAVEGVGTVTAVPDMAELSAGVVTRAATAREAMAQNSRAMGKVLAAVRAAGIEDRAVRTSQLSVSPIYDRNGRTDAQRAPAAYQASNVVEVTVPEVGRVGALVDTLVEAGANELRGIRFVIRDLETLQDEARRKAVQDARRKAGLYADAAEVRVGDILRIEEQQVSEPSPRLMAARVAQDTTVMPGEQTVRAVLAVRFAIP